jgi:hypothetical protein
MPAHSSCSRIGRRSPHQLPELVATELRRSGTPSVDQLYCCKEPQLGVGQSTDHKLEAAVGSAPWRQRSCGPTIGITTRYNKYALTYLGGVILAAVITAYRLQLTDTT